MLLQFNDIKEEVETLIYYRLSQNKIKLYLYTISNSTEQMINKICSIFLAGSTLMWQDVVPLMAGSFGCLKPRPSEFLVLIHW